MNPTQGLTGAARRVADSARSLVRLELQLAATEVKHKIKALAVGLGLVATGAALGFFALVFALAAAAAALATVLAVWLTLLVMFGVLLLLAGLLGMIGAKLLGKGASPVPEQALEEARLTTEALRNGH
jgi:membrane protein implicated in regulation of membrane protease activity